MIRAMTSEEGCEKEMERMCLLWEGPEGKTIFVSTLHLASQH